MAQETQVDMQTLMQYMRRERELMMNPAVQEQLDPMISVSLDNKEEDIVPSAEKGLGIGNAFTKDEVLHKAKVNFSR